MLLSILLSIGQDSLFFLQNQEHESLSAKNFSKKAADATSSRSLFLK